jgi:hypothetical protein
MALRPCVPEWYGLIGFFRVWEVEQRVRRDSPGTNKKARS